jgi:hypothetical protein
VIFKFGGKDYEAQCLDAIKSGSDLIFMIADEKGDVIDFQLPNDGDFKEHYDQACNRVRDFETDLKFSDDIRRNARRYAIWMCRPSPGEFRE